MPTFVNFAIPFTSSLACGVLVPIPTCYKFLLEESNFPLHLDMVHFEYKNQDLWLYNYMPCGEKLVAVYIWCLLSFIIIELSPKCIKLSGTI